ncbi:twin-arginine translocase TatA/TatE family subunit, partial [Methylosinus sp. R-45379]
MSGLSLWHWLIVGAVVVILFGRVTFSTLAADLAKGLREFRLE